MSVILLTGDHPRHLFLAQAVARTGLLSGLVLETREAHVPEPPAGLPARDRELFVHHFNARAAAEARFFSVSESDAGFAADVLKIKPDELNSEGTKHFISRHQPRLLLSYGVHILSPETLACAPIYRWNVHGGLSPWYRGAATHFWPSYFLEPQMTGMTIHETVEAIDGGKVIHQSVAPLVRGDGLHDLACRAVAGVAAEIPRLVHLAVGGQLKNPVAQKSSGRIWRGVDWRPCHLRLIYDSFDDRIVDRYLDGEFGQREPRLVRQFD
jgi:folate-dependent phosphoribosylglycinamide formyltransferase PurN